MSVTNYTLEPRMPPPRQHHRRSEKGDAGSAVTHPTIDMEAFLPGMPVAADWNDRSLCMRCRSWNFQVFESQHPFRFVTTKVRSAVQILEA